MDADGFGQTIAEPNISRSGNNSGDKDKSNEDGQARHPTYHELQEIYGKMQESVDKIKGLNKKVQEASDMLIGAWQQQRELVSLAQKPAELKRC